MFLIGMGIFRKGVMDGRHGAVHCHTTGAVLSFHTRVLETAPGRHTTDLAAKQTHVHSIQE